MKKITRFILATFLALSTTAIAQGVYEDWVAKYNGPGNGADFASALAIDRSGNVYVTGYSMQGGVTGNDYATIKYSPDGDTLWVRRYNGPLNFVDWARAIAVDDSGNVYVTGGSYGADVSFDFATIKYSPSGSTLWESRYVGPVDDDEAYDIAVDKNGKVYVAGYSEGSGTTLAYDYATVKYAPDGDSLWVRRYNGTGDDYDYATALAVDTAGNVYVTGRSWGGNFGQGGTGEDIATIKYLSIGGIAWVDRYAAGSWDGAYDVEVDLAGNVYVTGYSIAIGANSDYATIKYAPNGETLWVRRYNGPSNLDDVAYALAVDTAGNVYVTGTSAGSGTGYDYTTVKYSPSGDTLWVRRYNGPENGYDFASAVAVDSSGNVYVSGESKGPGSSSDYTTIKYAPNGDTLWVRRYNGPPVGDFEDHPSALAVDNTGHAYLARWCYGAGSNDYATIKYSPCSAMPGDVNSSSTITLGDIIHLLNFVFDRDNPPCLGTDPGNCWDFGLICRGDVNNSASITLGDIVHLLNYVFDRDNPPCLGTDPGNCWTPVANGACCMAVPSLKAN